ncbi:uncharacterized protein MELLADRAFT_111107 [Melampsora larici-populina 98AG31]|uniref:Uncharacterized protein n=1 Tax=Melampsora larici-populina (strain 98AG31 / pathotype 3-4-7) TaxID=747676 RepID=F4S222_MELLP|nr:uncharacterized protein MELLADRAFT_111107 [Melampsora larici-populina 98AG31]EGG01289.1 hypothetical protein MELLADRAFT_111107 [Melampsora larici-populina 98AG31]
MSIYPPRYMHIDVLFANEKTFRKSRNIFLTPDVYRNSDQQNNMPRIRIGVRHEEDRSVADPTTLPNCSRTLLYKFVNPYGMGSELGIYSMAAVVASAFNYTIIIDDSAWVYGRLEDTTRTLFENVGWDQPDHVYVDWDDMGRKGITQYLLGLVDRRTLNIHSVWNLINHREQRTVLPATQNLHYSMKSLFDARSEALRRIWRPNKRILDEIISMKKDLNDKMIESLNSESRKSISKSSILNFGLESPMSRRLISIHFRLGDKKVEHESWTPSAKIGLVSSFAKPKPFFDIVRSFVPNWKTSEDLPAVFVFSDDAKTAISTFEDYQSFYYPSQRFPLLSSPKGGELADGGHNQEMFDKAPLELRQNLTVALIRDMTFAVDNSEAVVCSSDAIGPEASIRSVDLRWHPTALANEFTEMGLDMIKNRTEILKMAPILAAEENNYIDL